MQSNGVPAVLKIGPPRPDIERESEALRLFAGHGAVALLKEDIETGTILIERALPGSALSNPSDEHHRYLDGGQRNAATSPLGTG